MSSKGSIPYIGVADNMSDLVLLNLLYWRITLKGFDKISNVYATTFLYASSDEYLMLWTVDGGVTSRYVHNVYLLQETLTFTHSSQVFIECTLAFRECT